MVELMKTCLNIDCPERTGGRCNAGDGAMNDEELPRAVQNGMSQQEYDVWMWAAPKYLDGYEPYTVKAPISEVIKFIESRDQQIALAAQIKLLQEQYDGFSTGLKGQSKEFKYTMRPIMASIEKRLVTLKEQQNKTNGKEKE
jgi:hypothetical protein